MTPTYYRYSLILLLIICLVVCSQWNTIIETFHQYDNPSAKIKVVSFENDPLNEHSKLLENKLKHYNYDYECIGTGLIWEGFGTKINEYQTYIRETTLRDTDILILIDSRDVYVNRPSCELIEAFERIYTQNGGDLEENLKLLFSSEVGCCADGLEDKYKTKMKEIGQNQQIPNEYYYLNSGMCIGYVKAFKQIYLNINVQNTDDDQNEIIKYWLDGNEDKICLDYNNLFSNAVFWEQWNTLDGCEYYKKNDYFYYKHTNTKPFFIQTNGKYWKCYDFLYGI